MLFNSIEFLLFFPIVTILYYLVPHKFRWLHLLLASCFFYMFFIPVYIFILFFTIVIDYYAGILLENTASKNKKFYLILSLIANIGVLSVFKYYNFFIDNVNTVLQGMHITTVSIPFLKIILPIGLSFHTFQAMSYTIEVYRGNQKAERHFGYYALYVMFYPQLVAGPIERPQNILHQLHEYKKFDYNTVVSGLRLMLWGFFKKCVIADKIALLADPVFFKPDLFKGFPMVIAILAFTFQIYCDFSGYSDIARGSARTMGINLMQNFNVPYISKSIDEFWRRWHISLSSWFRDYLYIPLGGNRVSEVRRYLNVFIVFLVSGLWHGANWTFVVWGALHGSFIILALGRDKFFPNIKLPSFFQWMTTFILVAMVWTFFRAKDIHQALYVLQHALSGITHPVEYLLKGFVYIKFWKFTGIDMIVLLISLFLLFYIEMKSNVQQWLQLRPVWVRWNIYILMTACIILFGVFDSRQFIYFQF
ncbi:MAG: rane bound O-acyl transferase family protein [Bacteroidota bacterium]|nr:rane bound O-acyl transferase family protein [Bacteroidota bacterium]